MAFRRPRGLELYSVFWMLGGAFCIWAVSVGALAWPFLLLGVPLLVFSALLWLGWRWPAWALLVLLSVVGLLLAAAAAILGINFSRAVNLIAMAVSVWELYWYATTPRYDPEVEAMLERVGLDPLEMARQGAVAFKLNDFLELDDPEEDEETAFSAGPPEE